MIVVGRLRASGALARLRDHAVTVLMDLTLPLCDNDYACFESPPD